MPFKDKEKAREYKRLWIAKKRKEGKNVEPSPVAEPKIVNVEPQHVKPLKSVKPCLHRLKSEKQVKELELKIISLQEINQILRKDLETWQEPTSPYEKSWKEKYLELEKKTDERWKEQSETINRLKEKLKSLASKNKEWEQKYRSLKKDRQK